MKTRRRILAEKATEMEAVMLASTRAADGTVDVAMLQFFYDQYHKRFLHDNRQIWENGKLLMPFSLSAFAAYALNEFDLAGALVLALVSTFLAFTWLVNAETHRAFQNKSYVVMRAVELALMGHDFEVPFKVADDDINAMMSKPAAVNLTIRGFFGGVVLGWLVIVVMHLVQA